jgi:hypothetical protein
MDLALIHLNFVDHHVVISGYHSPYKNIPHGAFKLTCPRVLNKSLPGNVFVIQYQEYCQFVIEIGTENYPNYVMFTSLVAFLTIVIIV